MEGTQSRGYTLSDIWRALKTEQRFNYTFWINILLDIMIDSMFRIMGYGMVIFATVIITTISLLSFFFVVPAVTEPSSFMYYFHYVWGSFMIYSIAFHYTMAITTNPGSPSDLPIDVQNNDFDQQCKKCNSPKPNRTHHCSVCKKCILKMDHHCPWIANCVGYCNYRYFVCFLLWVTFATGYVSVISFSLVFAEDTILNKSVGQLYTVFKPSNNNDVKHHNIYQSLSKSLKIMQEHQDKKHDNRKLFENLENENYFKSSFKANNIIEDDKKSNETNTNIYFTGSFLDYINLTLKPTNSVPNQRILRSRLRRRENNENIGGVSLYSLFGKALIDSFPEDELCCLMAFVFSVGVFLGAGMLLGFHLLLVSKGLTTLEYFESSYLARKMRKNGRTYINPHNKGLIKNIRQVFGKGPWYSAILPVKRNISLSDYPATNSRAKGIKKNDDNINNV